MSDAAGVSGAGGVRLADATIAIVGVGLLGGSLGRALAGKCARRLGVVAAGDTDSASVALELGAVDDVVSLEDAVAAADIVVLAAPVHTNIDLIPEVARSARPGTLVTDVGGSKTAVVAAMSAAALSPNVQLIGGHPMCGGTTGGVAASRADLFVDARWAVCPLAGAGDADPAVARLTELISAVDALPVICDATAHDRAVALVSHLPRKIATALCDVLDAQPEADRTLAHKLAGRGWAGVTRLAEGDAAMWDDVLDTNATEIARVAAELRDTLLP